MRFELLNVFSHEKENSGNQLAVVYPDKLLSDSEMQLIAQNFNFSETVFIFDNYDLRIFTPKSELPFAGHPSIGAGWSVGSITNFRNFSLRVPKGILEMEYYPEGSSLIFPGAPEVREFAGDLNHVLKHCSVNLQDVHIPDVRYIQTGPEFLVIPLKSRSALKKATSPVTTSDPLKCYFIFQEDPKTFHVRMFAPVLSVIEDAATGSAACALAAHQREVMEVVSGNIKIYQGVELGRPSQIGVSWNKKEIKLSGLVTKWATGEI